MAGRLITATSGRPAETAGGVGSIALLASVVVGVDDPETIALIGAVVGLLPSFVTLLVANGGLIGVAELIIRGKKD